MGALSKTLPQLASSKLFITEGGIETSLIYRKNIDIPGFSTLPLLGTEEGRKNILSIYQDYVKIALAHSTGIVLETRTWRGSPAWSSTIGLSVTQIVDLNRIAVRILRDLRHKAETPITPIVISGALGPLQDAYQDSTGRFTFSQAREHYGAQIRVFAEEGVDMSSIMTVTNLDEATAAVSVAREYNLPILVSFSIETDGRLRGGRTLEDAIREVDRVTDNYTTFETFAKTVDTFVASCKDDKRPIAHQISSQVVNFISTTYFASTDGNDFVPIRARSDPETTSKKPTTWAGIAQTPKNPDIESQAKGTHRVAISSKAAPTSARSGSTLTSQQRDDPRILVVLKQEDRLARKEPYAIRKQLESALKGVTPHTDIPKITRTATGWAITPGP
ncbi:hypothetical protein PDIDSM_177 [Penicillium digitatum]|nr:hypothetical protein PDIDSM_177 [Penicillium digitatum]